MEACFLGLFFVLLESAPLFQITWISSQDGGGGKKNVSGESGTDEPECCQHTSSIHAGSPYFIHTLQWALAFQTHYKSSNYFIEKKGQCNH